MVKIIVILVVVLLNILDVITTKNILNNHGYEKNKFMAFLISKGFYKCYVPVKCLSVIVVCVLMWYMPVGIIFTILTIVIMTMYILTLRNNFSVMKRENYHVSI